jgi:hypothetical protein
LPLNKRYNLQPAVSHRAYVPVMESLSPMKTPQISLGPSSCSANKDVEMLFSHFPAAVEAMIFFLQPHLTVLSCRTKSPFHPTVVWQLQNLTSVKTAFQAILLHSLEMLVYRAQCDHRHESNKVDNVRYYSIDCLSSLYKSFPTLYRLYLSDLRLFEILLLSSFLFAPSSYFISSHTSPVSFRQCPPSFVLLALRVLFVQAFVLQLLLQSSAVSRSLRFRAFVEVSRPRLIRQNES